MSVPWHQNTLRWGQTNITETDPQRYDIEWWRQHWKRTKIQGTIINAGGIVAYYPSKYPLHYQAAHLEGRDLYGEISEAAKEEGLTVLARMDSNRATENFFEEYPNWFARNKDNNPYKIGDRYPACIFSGYYTDFLPKILEEIIDRYQPDGFTDNSWSGLSQDKICYCENCRQDFLDKYGLDIPNETNWENLTFKKWIRWNYDRRLEIWDINNITVKNRSGNENCLWLGMISGNPLQEASRFRDMKGILDRSNFITLDYQHRPAFGFQSNSNAGKLLHGLIGWDKLVPESMPLYQGRTPAFRLSSKSVPEAHLWMAEGFAGTILPWWHHISAYHEDRRQYQTAEPIMKWHEKNEQFLINRSPVASVGILWSQENIDYHGKDDPEQNAMWPYEGMAQALIRGRIPYIPVHADHIDKHSDNLSVLILPNIGVMSDVQVESVRRFVHKGGSLIATGETSIFDEWGNTRGDFALSDIFGVHATGTHEGHIKVSAPTWEVYDHHSYLRIDPPLRETVYGPKIGEGSEKTPRHQIYDGFNQTDILPFGGRLENVLVDSDCTPLMTFIPAFPIFPPEFSWIREPDQKKPVAISKTTKQGGRTIYLAADIDRCFRRDNFPDHGNLLINLTRWVSEDTLPIKIEGPGLIDCQIYKQDNRLVIHLVNLTGSTEQPMHELVPVGPLHIQIKAEGSVKSLVNEKGIECLQENKWLSFSIPVIELHEVLVIEKE